MTKEKWGLSKHIALIIGVLFMGPFLALLWAIDPPEEKMPGHDQSHAFGLVACWWLLLAGVWLT